MYIRILLGWFFILYEVTTLAHSRPPKGTLRPLRVHVREISHNGMKLLLSQSWFWGLG